MGSEVGTKHEPKIFQEGANQWKKTMKTLRMIEGFSV
jgi:hypothetical protein